MNGSIDPVRTSALITALILIGVPVALWGVSRMVAARQKAFMDGHTEAWNTKLNEINEGLDDAGLAGWITTTLADQEADSDDLIVADAVRSSLEVGQRRLDLTIQLFDQAGALRREATAITYSVTLGAGALLIFSVTQLLAHPQPSPWLPWGLSHLGIAVISTFVARLLDASVAAGVLADAGSVIADPSWKNRAWKAYAIAKGGTEYRQPLTAATQVLFWWGAFFFVSGAALITVHFVEMAGRLAGAR